MKLIIFRGRRKIGTAPLTKAEMIVGRGADADVQLEDPTVSRQHARLTRKDDLVHIEDLGGAGGITINANPVIRARLLAGDRVEIGPFTLVLASEALGIATSLDVESLADFRAAASGDEETVQLSPTELKQLRGRQRTLLGAHLVMRGDQASTEFAMTDRTQVIGFSDDCEIQIPGFSLLGKRVAEIAPDGDGWAVVASSRLTSVTVNGEKIQRHRLSDGDMVEFKGVKMRFVAAVGSKK
ncbi:MAG: FHA domain-containing protein [Deltaproteobacteria bacterium]|nr:FHA domain-containing protein [Deltaproteobacteria bacterium]